MYKSAANCTSAAITRAAVAVLCVGRNSCTIDTGTLNGNYDPFSGHHKRLAVHATGCTAPPPPPPAPPPPGRIVLLAPRPACWDSGGICAGPQPERLASGDYLYVYNHDSHSQALPVGRCAMGWAVLDRDDPTRVVARGAEPLLTAQLPFEMKGHTPEVVFADGLRPMGGDEFIVTYGAADTDVGAVRIKVTTSIA